jgi:hypothetical protein
MARREHPDAYEHLAEAEKAEEAARRRGSERALRAPETVGRLPRTRTGLSDALR